MILTRVLAPYRRLGRPVWALFFIQVVNRMGDFVAPFLALFLSKKLGLSGTETGWWVTLTVLSGMAGILVSGPISDHFGRRLVLVWGLAFSALILAVAGFMTDDPCITPLLVAMSFFQGAIRPTIGALVADLTVQDQRKDAYALSYLGINVGVSVGPLIAGFLFEHNIHWLFWADSITSGLAIFMALAWIPPVHHRDIPEDANANPDESHQDGNPLCAFIKRPVLVFYSLLLLVVSFMYTQVHFALPLYTELLFPGQGASTFGWIMSFNAIVVLAFTTLLSILTRKQEPLFSMVVGSALYAVGFGMLAGKLSIPLLYLSTLIWTLGEILFSITAGVYFSARTPRNLRGRFQSYRECIITAGRMAAPVSAGLLIDTFGHPILWISIGLAGIASVFGFLRLSAMDRNRAH